MFGNAMCNNTTYDKQVYKLFNLSDMIYFETNNLIRIKFEAKKLKDKKYLLIKEESCKRIETVIYNGISQNEIDEILSSFNYIESLFLNSKVIDGAINRTVGRNNKGCTYSSIMDKISFILNDKLYIIDGSFIYTFNQLKEVYSNIN